jgi:putative component of toxin-antitoxin plasmid stabilization module
MQRPEGVFTPCNKGLLEARADDFSGGRLFYERRKRRSCPQRQPLPVRE